MTDNIAPEEKLLKLIRGQKKKGSASEIKPVIPVGQPHPPLPSQKINKHQAVHIPLEQYLSFFYFRKAIKICFALSCIFLVYSFIYPLFGLKKIQLPKVVPQRAIAEKDELPQKEKPYEFYLEKAKDRMLFGNIAGAGETSASSVAAEAGSIKDINLLGIISGDNPQAVVEDKKSQKTYYVSKGQSVGDFQVEDIQEGRIILNNRGQRYELQI